MKTNLNLAAKSVQNYIESNMELPLSVKKNEALAQNNFTFAGLKSPSFKMNETDLTEITDEEFVDDTKSPNKTSSETVKPKIIGTPEEVTTNVTQEQQNTIDNIVEYVAHRYGAKDILDNVLYKDSNGNPQSQVIKYKNEDGTYSTVKIKYDEQGRIAQVAVEQRDNINAVTTREGHWISFDYKPDGNIYAHEHSGVKNDDGVTLEYMVAHETIKIGKDGKTGGIYDYMGAE